MRTLFLILALLSAGCADDDGHPADAEDHPHDLGLPQDGLPTVSGPIRLSETGLYSDFPARTLSPGIIEYTPQYQLWSDGAEKKRYLLLPPGSVIDTSQMDHWVFPIGTRVWKEFSKDGKVVETRLLQKIEAGSEGWWMAAYLWNDAGTEADAVIDGRDNARGTTHRVPSQEDCFKCHLNVKDVLIGVSAIQLAGLLDGRLSSPPATQPVVPGSGVVKDALGYLHGNCGHCHNDQSYFRTESVLRLRLSVTDTVPEQTPSYLTSVNVKMFHKLAGTTFGVVPGKPEESQLWVRMGLRDLDAMPPVCSKVVDAFGMQTVGDWIRALP